MKTLQQVFKEIAREKATLTNYTKINNTTLFMKNCTQRQFIKFANQWYASDDRYFDLTMEFHGDHPDMSGEEL